MLCKHPCNPIKQPKFSSVSLLASKAAKAYMQQNHIAGVGA